MQQLPTVTIIIPVYKVERVLADVLKSIYGQTYPIQKMLLIDNHSPDRSVAVAQAFIKMHHRIPIKIIQRKKTYGLSHSYNLGAALARSKYIVTLHSDSTLPTKFELARLMSPFVYKKNFIAAMPNVVHRKIEWDKYNFWQKCLFASVVETKRHSLNGKFDAYDRDIFLSVGGYDTKNFDHYIGSEDADMNFRLASLGKIAVTNARVVHLHGRDINYSMQDWVKRRKFLAISYALQIRLHWREMGVGFIPFLVKPMLVVLTILSFVYPLFVLPLIIFPFWYMWTMFTDSVSRRDRNILLLPIVVICLVFLETFWMTKGLFVKRYTL
ncbi:MAG: glycosyltransferase [Patescibacteria group bacterium]